MAKDKIVHTCYGCPYYYRRKNEYDIPIYCEPYSVRHCDIENPWDCDYFANGGEPRKKV